MILQSDQKFEKFEVLDPGGFTGPKFGSKMGQIHQNLTHFGFQPSQIFALVGGSDQPNFSNLDGSGIEIFDLAWTPGQKSQILTNLPLSKFVQNFLILGNFVDFEYPFFRMDPQNLSKSGPFGPDFETEFCKNSAILSNPFPEDLPK